MKLIRRLRIYDGIYLEEDDEEIVVRGCEEDGGQQGGDAAIEDGRPHRQQRGLDPPIQPLLSPATQLC